MEDTRTFTAKNGKDVLIRPVKLSDAAGISETLKSSSDNRSYVLMELYGMDTDGHRAFIETLQVDRDLLLVAESDGKIVGSLAALIADNGMREETLHIVKVGVHLMESYRGNGIGSKMLQYAVDWAIEIGYKKLEASIFLTNQASLGMFKKLDFIEEGRKHMQIRLGKKYIDEVSMARIL